MATTDIYGPSVGYKLRYCYTITNNGNKICLGPPYNYAAAKTGSIGVDGVDDDGVGSSSPKRSKNPATRALFPAFFVTYSRRPDFRLGCLSTSSRSCSFGSWRRAPKLAGAITLAHRMNPSHKWGFCHIFFVIKRESRVVDTNATSDLYVVTAWITYPGPTINHQPRSHDKQHTVLRNNTGNTGSSTICCITTARISERKTSVIEKQIPMAESTRSHKYATVIKASPTFDGALETNFFFGFV